MRPIDKKNPLADIEGLKKSPWFNADYISDERRLGMKEALDMMSSIIRNAPTEAEPVKRGRWIKTGARNIYGGIQIECSECGDRYLVQHIEDEWFCRHCGAKMMITVARR